MAFDLEHLEALVRGELTRHLAVAEASKARRHDQQLRARLTGDEGELALAVDRDHGVLQRAESNQRPLEHEGLEAGRQRPGDGRPLADTAFGQRGGDALARVAVVAVGNGAVALVDREHGLGCGLGSRFDQGPERACTQRVAQPPNPSALARSRSANFVTLPEAFIGNSSSTRTYRGTL
jgi:hypothetical protein